MIYEQHDIKQFLGKLDFKISASVFDIFLLIVC